MDGWIREGTTNHRMTVGYVDKLSFGRRKTIVERDKYLGE